MMVELTPINRPFEAPFPSKQAIPCIHTAKEAKDHDSSRPDLIFTHGAGGTLQADAMVNFSYGFALNSQAGITAFKGNMNLKSRVKMFEAVIHNQEAPKCLGGRSMGARAAIMAAAENTTHLVLVSYPLHTDTVTRDQILLDLPPHLKVIFVSGENDTMCDLDRLESVRSQMKCKSWRVVVQDADHGMNIKPKAGTKTVGRKTGEVVAHWLDNPDENMRESRIAWDSEAEIAQWSGWSSEAPISFTIGVDCQPPMDETNRAKRPNGRRKELADNIESKRGINDVQGPSESRYSKRRKI